MDIVTLALCKKEVGKGTAEAVSAYLDEHLTNPTDPPIDTSLSIAGAAADAKETGDKITQLKEDLSQVLSNNFLYDENSVIITGTTFANKKIYESAVSDLSVKWTLEIEDVVGANASLYALIQYFDTNDTKISQTGTSTTLPIKLTVTPPSGTVKIVFILCASQATALPTGSATFYGVKVYQGTERIYSINESINYERLDEDETRISDLETDVGQYEGLLTSSRNIATKFVDARINIDTGAVYQPAGITGYGATVTAMEVDPSTQYTITLDFTIKYSNIIVFAYGANGNYIGTVTPDRSVLSNGDKNNIVVFTTDANTHFVRVHIYTSLQAFSEDHILVFQLEKGGVPSMPVNQVIVNNDIIDAETQYKKLANAGVIDGEFVVPDYYNDDNYLNNKIDRINELCEMCGATGDAFIFITDEHMTAGQNRKTKPNQGNSYSLIKKISENCRIPRLFDGGDNADMGSIDHTLNLKKAFNGNIYHVTGNHDAFYQTSKETLYYYMDMYNDDQVGNNENRYFYVDNQAKKIRYIILASSEGDAATENENNGIFGTDTDQMTWLTNVALDVEAGWDIIVFIHMMFYVNANVSRTLNRYGTALETALDSYSGNGKILAVIQGHTHVDRIAYTTGGIPVIMTTCDKNTPANIGDVDDLTFDRPTGTISEQAFDVVILDRTNKTFHFVRIGAKAQNGVGDNIGDFAEERTITYT